MNTFLNILFKNWLIILLLILTIGPVIFLFINYYLMTMNNECKFEEENRTIIIKSKKSGQSAYINNSQIIKIFHIQGPINGDAPWYFFSYLTIYTKNKNILIISFLNLNIKNILKYFDHQSTIKIFPYIKSMKRINNDINNYFNTVDYFYEKYKYNSEIELNKLYNNSESLIPEASDALNRVLHERSIIKKAS